MRSKEGRWVAALAALLILLAMPSVVDGGGHGARPHAVGAPIPVDANYLVAHAGYVWFEAYDTTTNDYGLWESNGTSIGTNLVEPGIAPQNLIWVGSQLFFTAYDGAYGRQLWVTDGGFGHAHRIGAVAGGLSISTAVAFGSRLVFSGCDDFHGCEPWISNGTEAGTHRLKDIVPGTDGSEPGEFTVDGGKVIFRATDRAHGGEIWRTDGTGNGTRLIKDIRPGPHWSSPYELARVASRVVFWANDDIHGEEPWVTDGTANGTHVLRDIAHGTVGSLVSEGTPMVVFRGELWLVANDGVHGAELWHTNGTTAGTKLALDVDPGSHSSDPYGLIVDGRTLLFGARDRSHGYELWVTDGSPHGTRLVRDIYAGGGSSYPTTWAGLPMTQGRVVVLADDGHHGYEPWVSNGTKKGTRLLRDVTPGSGGSYWYSAASLGTRVLFSMIDGNVWVSDGKHGPGHTDKLANF